MQFNPSSTTGIVYLSRFYAKANSNDLTTQDIVNLSNASMSEIHGLVKPLSKTLVFDDPSYGDDPYETYDIASGTARRTLSTDGNSASVLGIKKVAAADSSGLFRIIPLATLDEVDSKGFINQSNTAGVPERYFIFGNTFVVDPTPNYDYTGGYRVFYDRMLDQFTSSDTTAEPGFDPNFHELIPLMNAYRWCLRESKFSTANGLLGQIAELKRGLIRNYGHKAGQDRTQGLRPNRESTR